MSEAVHIEFTKVGIVDVPAGALKAKESSLFNNTDPIRPRDRSDQFGDLGNGDRSNSAHRDRLCREIVIDDADVGRLRERREDECEIESLEVELNSALNILDSLLRFGGRRSQERRTHQNEGNKKLDET
jgi:hypothetical protein